MNPTKKRDQFDSDEEWYFSWYVDELIAAGMLIEAEYHPQSFELSSEKIVSGCRVSKKAKVEAFHRKLLNGHIYTADWKLTWPVWATKFLVSNLNASIENVEKFFRAQRIEGEKNLISYIDVKGANHGVNNTSSMTFPLNQKWVMDRYGIYVQKVIPVVMVKDKQGNKKFSGLFPETFTPERYLMQNERPAKRTIHYDPVMIDQFLK